MQANIVSTSIKFSHDIDYLLDLFQRLPRKKVTQNLQDLAGRYAIYTVGTEGTALMGLAPKKPALPGSLPRNTEYPYGDATSGWRSPAESGSFTLDEVRQFLAVAQRSLDAAKTIFDVTVRLT